MSGQNNLLNVKVKELYHCAFFVHCYSHLLNLTLQQSASNIKECRIFFQTLSCLAPNFLFKTDECSSEFRWKKVAFNSTNQVEFYFKTREDHKRKLRYMLLLFFEHIHENSDEWDSESILKKQGFFCFYCFKFYWSFY